MLSWDNFQKVFETGKRPYWWLYSGKNKTVLIGSNTDMENMTDSFRELSDLVETYGPGCYTIEVRTSINASKNNPLHTFSYGDYEASLPVSGIGNVRPVQPAIDHSAAFSKGVDMRYWLDKDERKTEQIRILELKLMAAENRIERLKDLHKQQEQPDALGRVLGLVERKPELLTHISGLFSSQPLPAAIGQLKAKKPIPPPQPAQDTYEDDNYEDDGEYEDDEYEDDETTAVPAGNFSIDRAVQDCYRMIQALPEHNINDLLKKLADTAQTNPAKIKMAINYL